MLRNKIIASVVIVGVICLIFFTIFHPPKRKVLLQLKSEYTELDRTIRIAREDLKQYSRLEREYDSLMTNWERIEQLLPDEREIPDLLENIAKVARNCGVVLSEFKPLGPVPLGFTTEIPISFRVTSNYHQLGRFLSDVGRLSRLLKVRDVNITPHMERGSKTITLQADFVVSAYIVTKGAMQAEGK